jgi:hypothetical protein
MTADSATFTGNINSSALRQTVSITSGSTYAFSIYARTPSGTGTLSIDLGDGTNVTQVIDSTWQRYTFILVAGFLPHVDISSTTASTYYIWGAQLEAGSYATSYIPTTSASVTRNADVISKTGISSLIGQTEGTMFWEVSKQLGENDVRLSISNSSTNDWLFVGIEFNNLPRIYCNAGGVNQFSIYGTQISNDFHKVAFAYKANDFALYIDGVQVITHTSGNVPTCSRLDVANIFPGSDTYATSNNKAAALWKQRLTNTQLAQLTTI